MSAIPCSHFRDIYGTAHFPRYLFHAGFETNLEWEFILCPCTEEQILHPDKGQRLYTQPPASLHPRPDPPAALEKTRRERRRLCGCWGARLARIYLRDTVLGALRHRVGHRQVIDHHDVLVGLIDRSGRLRPGTDGRAAVLDGGSGRLYLRPLKKLEQGRERGERTRTGQTSWGGTGNAITTSYYCFSRVVTPSENCGTGFDRQ